MADLNRKAEELFARARANLSPWEVSRLDSMFVGQKLTESTLCALESEIKRSEEAHMSVPVTITDGTNAYMKSVPDKIAPHNAYHSASDEAGRCPHCYMNGNQKFMGMLTVDNEERPTYHCTSCNKAYAELPAAIKTIMQDLKQAGHQKVGFEPAQGSNGFVAPQNNYETQQTNQKLDQVNSNLSNLSGTIYNLMEQVRQLAEQNNKMMEQLATDPLVSVRKSVVEFNLK